jgi:hypothetical protein
MSELIKLSSGKELVFDWSKIGQRELRIANEIGIGFGNEVTDTIIGKVLDMSADEIADMSAVDYAMIRGTFWPSYMKMLEGMRKNLESASISD